MATYYHEPSRTFSEYLLLPNLTTRDCTPDRIDLTTPLVRYRRGDAAIIEHQAAVRVSDHAGGL